jgi:penicillin-binding protein 1C
LKKKLQLSLGAFLFLVGGLLAFRIVKPSPLQGVGFSVEVFAEKEELLRLTLSPDEKYRIFRPLRQMSPDLVQAVLLNEDRYFRYHPGVNPVATFRALGSLGANRKIGGSTITMQMVRLKHHLYTKNLFGKLQQMIFAVGYELLYSKNEILEAYLNLTPYGGNIEGVEAASQIYFGKSAKDLDLLEALTLAVIPQNPVKRSLNQEDQQKVSRARQILLSQWLQVHPDHQSLVIGQELPVLANHISQLPFRAPHFVERTLAWAPDKKRITTSLSWELQKKLEETLTSYLASVKDRGIQNGSLLLIRGDTREIKAWVGSGDYFNSEIQGQIDGNSVQRSPGSTLKPLVYGLAMDEGLIHPLSLLKDTPSSFGSFDPENFDRKYLGPVSATDALIHSRNVPAIQLTSGLKRTSLYGLLQDIGVKNLRSEKTYGLGITLGTAEITPLDLGGLYTALYHLGEWAPLKWESTSKAPRGKRILSQESAFLALDMLTHSIRDTSSLMDEQMKSHYPVAWKTGTSFGFRDAWTAGVFGPYVLIAWLGNFDSSENPHLIGRDMASPLFFKVVDLFPQSELQNNSAWTNSFGLNLKKVDMCAVSGQLVGEHCPHHVKSWFIPGVSPIEACTLHREIAISRKSGRRLCGEPQEPFVREVYEFWPSDLIDIFQKFGIQRKSPPAFASGCEQSGTQEGLAPEITSPKHDVQYILSFQKSKLTEKVPLRAISDGDVKSLSWFVNDAFVAKASPRETVFFDALPGSYEIVLVDDHGRSTSRSMNVTVRR